MSVVFRAGVVNPAIIAQVLKTTSARKRLLVYASFERAPTGGHFEHRPTMWALPA
jgi:hypothetical protein